MLTAWPVLRFRLAAGKGSPGHPPDEYPHLIRTMISEQSWTSDAE